MLVLDVGSGLTCSSPLLTKNSTIVHLDILKSCKDLEVQATVYNLPFKNKTFDITVLSHVLEHLQHPLKALQEVKRITKKLVVVRVPNELYTNQFLHNECCHEHLYSWTCNTLTRLLENVFPKVTVQTMRTITRRTEQAWFKRKLKTLKTYLIALFYTRKTANEIVAYCKIN